MNDRNEGKVSDLKLVIKKRNSGNYNRGTR